MHLPQLRIAFTVCYAPGMRPSRFEIAVTAFLVIAIWVGAWYATRPDTARQLRITVPAETVPTDIHTPAVVDP